MRAADYLESNAIFSGDQRYRYVLIRKWGTQGRRLNTIGLNPSTADAFSDDPTIKSDVRLARNNGYDELWKYNLFGIISSDPKALDCPDPVGPLNDEHLKSMRGDVVFCWGSWGKLHLPIIQLRIEEVRGFFIAPYCFGRNKDGEPRHTLYLLANTKLERY